MNSDELSVLSDASDRFAAQYEAGEWSGPADRHWLAWTWPCGRGRCRVCDPEKGGRADRGVVWSQLLAATP